MGGAGVGCYVLVELCYTGDFLALFSQRVLQSQSQGRGTGAGPALLGRMRLALSTPRSSPGKNGSWEKRSGQNHYLAGSKISGLKALMGVYVITHTRLSASRHRRARAAWETAV